MSESVFVAHSYDEICGVFSTEEKARQHEALHDCALYKWELDGDFIEIMEPCEPPESRTP